MNVSLSPTAQWKCLMAQAREELAAMEDMRQTPSNTQEFHVYPAALYVCGLQKSQTARLIKHREAFWAITI